MLCCIALAIKGFVCEACCRLLAPGRTLGRTFSVVCVSHCAESKFSCVSPSPSTSSVDTIFVFSLLSAPSILFTPTALHSRRVSSSSCVKEKPAHGGETHTLRKTPHRTSYSLVVVFVESHRSSSLSSLVVFGVNRRLRDGWSSAASVVVLFKHVPDARARRSSSMRA